MKAVLISIQPKWCAKIANGEKTIEVRKNKPKLETPFKCYIYCTKEKLALLMDDSDIEKYKYDVWETTEFHQSCGKKILGGKVIGEFVCKAILPISITYSDQNSRVALREFPSICLTDKEIMDYLGNGKEGYGWCISDLVIYDKPKELSEFYRHDNTYNNAFGWLLEDREKNTPITRPPQSWCYVEDM